MSDFLSSAGLVALGACLPFAGQYFQRFWTRQDSALALELQSRLNREQDERNTRRQERQRQIEPVREYWSQLHEIAAQRIADELWQGTVDRRDEHEAEILRIVRDAGLAQRVLRDFLEKQRPKMSATDGLVALAPALVRALRAAPDAAFREIVVAAFAEVSAYATDPVAANLPTAAAQKLYQAIEDYVSSV